MHASIDDVKVGTEEGPFFVSRILKNEKLTIDEPNQTPYARMKSS